MYHVALCEDEQIFSVALEKDCRTIFQDNNIEYDLSVFANGTELLAAYKTQPKPFDLIILDIVMEDFNGIEVAKKIRQLHDDVMIIFITANKDYIFQIPGVHPFNFLTETSHMKIFIAP
ncbi:MAG: response regulator [Oscillospiraceae bacterium]|nr:response regulator [Oscillospiraceae bacterium]